MIRGLKLDVMVAGIFLNQECIELSGVQSGASVAQ